MKARLAVRQWHRHAERIHKAPPTLWCPELFPPGVGWQASSRPSDGPPTSLKVPGLSGFEASSLRIRSLCRSEGDPGCPLVPQELESSPPGDRPASRRAPCTPRSPFQAQFSTVWEVDRRLLDRRPSSHPMPSVSHPSRSDPQSFRRPLPCGLSGLP